jgi:hypothetical protein
MSTKKNNFVFYCSTQLFFLFLQAIFESWNHEHIV